MMSMFACVLARVGRAISLAQDVRATDIIRCSVILPLLDFLIPIQVRIKSILPLSILNLLVLVQEIAGYDHR